MTATKKELFETIELIPDAIANELLNYADYLTSKYFEKKMPDRVVIKDNEDLKTKINERIQNIESGKVKMLTIDEAFEEIDKV